MNIFQILLIITVTSKLTGLPDIAWRYVFIPLYIEFVLFVFAQLVDRYK